MIAILSPSFDFFAGNVMIPSAWVFARFMGNGVTLFFSNSRFHEVNNWSLTILADGTERMR